MLDITEKNDKKLNGKIFDFYHFLCYNRNVVERDIKPLLTLKIYNMEGDNYMFNVGDKIVYPMHGAGTIDAIEEKDILGEKQNYYIIKMPGEVKVMVPISKADDVGVRGIIDKEEAGKVLQVLEADETEMPNNWNKRYKENMEKMKSGNIYEVADVVRNLSYKQKEKGLSTGEKKMLNNAKQILVSELVLAEHASEDEVENLVENKINLSFEEHKNVEEPVNTNNVVSKFIPFNDVNSVSGGSQNL